MIDSFWIYFGAVKMPCKTMGNDTIKFSSGNFCKYIYESCLMTMGAIM
jgi:hypothetical protein